MRKALLLSIILLVFISGKLLQAQQWSYRNPTYWYDINTVEILAPGVIVVGGGWESRDSVQLMAQTADYGLTWYENAHNGYAPWNKSIAFSDAYNGYGVGYDGRIISTGDAGRNWGFPSTPINRDLNKIVYAGAGTYYIAGGNKTNDSIQTILKSTDYGNTWNVIYDVQGPWLTSIFFIDTLKGFAVGDNGVILCTMNAGSTWTSVTAPIQRDFNAVTFINADTGYIVGGTATGLCHRTIVKTVNGGINWSVLTDNIGGVLKDISFADTLVGYSVGDSASVLKTNDGGQHWTPLVIDSTLAGNEIFNAVKFYGRNFGVIGGRNGVCYIYLDMPVEAYTLGLSHIGTNDATLLGGINTHSKNARYSFVYSNNMHFISSDTTHAINSQNDSLLLVSEHIQGLTPNTVYYFYLKAVTASGIVYGDTLNFYTGINPFFDFQTTDATGVGTSVANLNGFINKCPKPVSLFFEYGDSPAFGSQVAASPSTINDTLMHYTHAIVANLRAGRQYFFRLKGVADSGMYYGYTKNFYAVNLPQVNTGYATSVTSNSAQLNGIIRNNGLPSVIKFEYGPTVQYVTEANAVPDSVTGNNIVNATYSATGLIPRMTYHFRLKVINSAGTSYGQDMTFITGGPAVNTYPALDIGLYSALLSGSVNANNYPAAVKFEYGLTDTLGIEENAVPDSVIGNLIVPVSCRLAGVLQSGTTYFYRVMATNELGSVYGNIMNFQTNSPPFITTLPATEITTNSARLNGSINTGGTLTAIRFEYGNTTSYGNEFIPVPDSSSIAGNVDVTAVISGLAPNTIYHYRLKGENSIRTNFGNDLQFYTGSSEIPNFDFEMWSSLLFYKPNDWQLISGKVSRTGYACHGNFAVKIKNDTLNEGQPGAILTGTSNVHADAFIGGIPFSGRPDTLIACLNYSIASNDTGSVLIILKKRGIPVSYKWHHIIGSSSGQFTEKKFPIEYNSAETPDSLILGFSPANIPNIPQQFNGSDYLIVDNIHFSGTTEDILNNDFENWHLDTLYSPDYWIYNQMNKLDPLYPESLPLKRTSDAQHGNYAALISNYIHPGKTINGWLTTGPGFNTPDFSVNSRHQFLTGYFKFLPENNDTMVIQILMFKNHQVLGSGNMMTSTPSSNYSPFEINIFYTDSTIPDSGKISIKSFNGIALGKSRLYIDNLNFDGFISGIKDPPITNAGKFGFNIFPNPISSQATIAFSMNQDEHVTINLFNISGKQVAVLANGYYKKGDYKINLSSSGLCDGFYICVINTNSSTFSKKIIIQ